MAIETIGVSVMRLSQGWDDTGDSQGLNLSHSPSVGASFPPLKHLFNRCSRDQQGQKHSTEGQTDASVLYAWEVKVLTRTIWGCLPSQVPGRTVSRWNLFYSKSHTWFNSCLLWMNKAPFRNIWTSLYFCIYFVISHLNILFCVLTGSTETEHQLNKHVLTWDHFKTFSDSFKNMWSYTDCRKLRNI